MNDGGMTQNTTRTLGRYHLLRRIGKGGMGDVWLGEDPRLHRQVAIKTLPSRNQQDREFSLRFEREAQAAAALNHPHILPVHDYGEQVFPNGQLVTYIVMPYIAGGSLAERITALGERNSGIPPQEALAFLMQAAEAIDYAHQQGVLHRDIKPGNMLLRSDNWLMLADFGIARIMSNSEHLTQTGMGFGTPEYMAPEQAQGKAEVASDNYSLAVIAYQLFTGRLPFSADTAYATTIQHMTLPPPAPRQYNPAMTPAFEQVLLQGLAKIPAQRPASARAFITALQQATIDEGAEEATYVKPLQTNSAFVLNQNGLPSTTGANSPTEQKNFSFQQVSTPNTGQDPQTSATLPSTNPQRRRLLIGGGAALVALIAGGGILEWIANTRSQTPTTQSSSSNKSAQSTSPNPNAPVLVLRGHNKPVASLAWSPTNPGTLISSGSNDDGMVLLWDIQALQKQKSQNPQPKANVHLSTGNDIYLAWSPKGDMLAIGNAASDMNAAKVFVYTADLAGFAPGYTKNNISIKNSITVSSMSWSPSNYLLTMTNTVLTTNIPTMLQVWDPGQPGNLAGSIQISHYLSSDNTITLNQLAPAPKLAPLTLAIGTSDGVLLGELHASAQPPTWQQRILLKLNGQDTLLNTKIGTLAWSGDGQYLCAMAEPDTHPTTITTWNIPNNRSIILRVACLQTQARS
ncbi:hypothetical protein EPA93_47510 [Ktedonosporobacter rubrisoli]|uniref:non-specific serine/threonine protein kinase n=1 Tax=Ktedonosporobacter rubrisoli TaxID=2509675 RepID=A0A4P6K4G4_KTERU|nr:WD40 repeat domain-containing serine/threonine-protein kinase [Ktedonosporobacter rubrisoli]QBD83208.1 hypothetical protein EPA93_47510 [Ktedonosporobacter rubrisoli]